MDTPPTDGDGVTLPGTIVVYGNQVDGRASPERAWFAVDEDDDGVAEAIGKWASLRTAGAEATGLYFDPFNPHIAYVNVQHPDSGEDLTIMFLAPWLALFRFA